MSKFISEMSVSDQIEELQRRINSGQLSPDDLTSNICKLRTLHEQLDAEAWEFFEELRVLMPNEKKFDLYRASRSVPIKHKKQFLQLLTEGLSLREALSNFKL